jgi:putative membrane protein
MIQAVSTFDLEILIPVIIGIIIGLIAFSHILSWIYKKYKDQTISLLTGFILGSLSILWPWKNEVYLLDSVGDFILKDGEKISLTQTKYIPETISTEVILAISLMIIGFITIYLIEKLASTQE